jgi:hypothetical protein
MRAELPLRLARTATFAAVCVTLAALAHLLGGGSVPDPPAAALGLAGAFAPALLLCGRERSAATVNVTLVCAQFGLHELFGADGTAYLIPHLHGHGLGTDAGMLVAHLTATLIAGWWLARGETALWSLLRRLPGRGLRLLLLRPAAVQPVRQAAPIVHDRAAPFDPAIRHSLARRGPPLPA